MTGAISGLLRRGAPVWVALVHSDHVRIEGVMFNGEIVAVRDGGISGLYKIGTGPDDDVSPEDVALDLRHPLACEVALQWFSEQGFDVRWMLGFHAPALLAWSAKNVIRGGVPIHDLSITIKANDPDPDAVIDCQRTRCRSGHRPTVTRQSTLLATGIAVEREHGVLVVPEFYQTPSAPSGVSE